MIRKWQKRSVEMKADETTKTRIRKQIRNQKKELSTEEITKRSHDITTRLVELSEYKAASRIYAYVSYNQEVSTFEFMEQVLKDGKTLLVPRVYGEIMRYHEISDFAELKPGAYGILEPDNNRIDAVGQGFMLLPGLAFDKMGHRIGYGGGFYDKYLKDHPGHYKTALAYEFQLLEEIPWEEHDIPVDCVITEKNINIF